MWVSEGVGVVNRSAGITAKVDVGAGAAAGNGRGWRRWGIVSLCHAGMAAKNMHGDSRSGEGFWGVTEFEPEEELREEKSKEMKPVSVGALETWWLAFRSSSVDQAKCQEPNLTKQVS